MAVPKIEKITINMGLGSALGDKKIIEHQFNRQSQNHHGLTYKAE
jgi:large subunit ribosomal protein L5